MQTGIITPMEIQDIIDRALAKVRELRRKEEDLLAEFYLSLPPAEQELCELVENASTTRRIIRLRGAPLSQLQTEYLNTPFYTLNIGGSTIGEPPPPKYIISLPR